MSMTRTLYVQRIVAAVFVVVTGAASARAQASLPAPGSHIRIHVTSPSDGVTVGHLESIRADTIVVRAENASVSSSISLRDVSSLEVFRRGSTAAAAGFLAGAAGAVLGGVGYHNWCRDNPDACRQNRIASDSTNVGRYDRSVSVLTAFVVGGTALGAVIGYGLAPSEWDPVQLPVRLGLYPAHGGVTVTAAIRFGGRDLRIPRPLRTLGWTNAVRTRAVGPCCLR
jgi:hypothetical protein